MPDDWHLVHLGSRAVGGAGLVMVEASGVSPEGRITAWDSGIWSEAHAKAFAPIVELMHRQGSVAGIQLAHGRRFSIRGYSWQKRSRVRTTRTRVLRGSSNSTSLRDQHGI